MCALSLKVSVLNQRLINFTASNALRMVSTIMGP
jgi:hypothetical protein